MKVDRTISCLGLYCPIPIVKTKLELETMNYGEVLEVTVDDPGFEKDLPAWCQMTGHEFLGIFKEGNIYKGYVRKK